MSKAFKPIREVQAGDRTEAGWIYISEPAEQPDGSYSVMMRAPSGMRRLVDFDNGDAPSDVPDDRSQVIETARELDAQKR